MQPNDTQRRRFSRRGLLRGAAAFATASAMAQRNDQNDDDNGNGKAGGPVLAYVGAYTPNGQGIHQFSVNTGNGKLTPAKIFPSVNPSWITFDPQKKYLYAVNEISNFMGGTTGSVSAFAVSANGDLTLLNTVSSGGAGPAHCSVHPSGKFVLVANYGGGNVAVLPVLAGGMLGAATDNQMDVNACVPGPCQVGPTKAQKAPPGSFAISGHDKAHAHMIQSDPTGNFVVVNDLGLDRTIIWKFDAVNGKLTDPKTVPSSLGAGPRHFVFHPNGHWFYSLNEEASTLAFLMYDGTNGTLTPVDEIQTLPAAFVGTNFCSEVILSHDGKFIYAANRLHDSVAVFAIEGNGTPKLIGEQWTRGDYPRNINIEPTGNFLYACNHRGDSVTTFRIGHGHGNGALSFTGQYTAVGSPAVIIFLQM